MMKNIDKRVIKTKYTLAYVLVELLGEKNFDDISVQNILDRALVNRSTFYKHYANKYELAETLIRETYGDIIVFFDAVFDLHDQGEGVDAIIETAFYGYRKMWKDRKKILALFDLRVQDLNLYDLLHAHAEEKYVALYTGMEAYNDKLAKHHAKLCATVVLAGFRWTLETGNEAELPLFYLVPSVYLKKLKAVSRPQEITDDDFGLTFLA